jgi:CarboxypepD_reg-like domain/TonB-dependent Receptor Plug Domain
MCAGATKFNDWFVASTYLYPMLRTLLLFICILGVSVIGFSQTSATITGKIADIETLEPIEFVGILVKETGLTAETNELGEFTLVVPASKALNLRIVRVGYQEALVPIPAILPGQTYQVSLRLSPNGSLKAFEVLESRLISDGMIRQDVRAFKLLPSTTGNLESLLPSLALGTNSGSGGELTSQYQVRGGNYDENLVYVNDFEVYRPQLVRSGQQEGLTFPNIDLISSLSFSSGGFESRYGDKLSSVLDIKYKRPDSTAASFNASMLGGGAHVEGCLKLGKSNYKKFRYLTGARYKTTRYLLGTLDVTGEYQPDFGDVQSYLTFDLSSTLQLGAMGNINYSRFGFVPSSRTTATGLIDFALQLSTAYEGQEISQFLTGMGGLSLTYLPNRKRNPLFVKLLAYNYQSDEQERVDIIGYYQLGQIDINLGSDKAGEVVGILGQGAQQQYYRNYLLANVSTVELKGGYEHQTRNTTKVQAAHFINWGIKAQYEVIDDRINEWERLDSALYSLPYSTDELLVRTVYKTENHLESYRASGYVQNTYSLRKDSVVDMRLTVGTRAQYWSLNQELIITPRAQLLWTPLKWKRDYSFKIGGGLYHQPAFYREMRRIDGTVNTNLLAQKSGQVLAGFTHDWKGKGSRKVPYRLIVEAYYKQLWDMVTYDLDNVRIRYAGENNATGYVTGIDMRINGEFVPDAESWVNFSFLRAREGITGVEHRIRKLGQAAGEVVKDVPRPSDRFFTMSMFFQDYLRNNKHFKTHMQLSVGTGQPFGFPDNNVIYRNPYRFRPYHRIDIGFSYVLFQPDFLQKRPNHFLKFTRYSAVSLEIFNMMQSPNVASNVWIRTIENTQYAIPNFLTSRRVNLRLRFDF